MSRSFELWLLHLFRVMLPFHVSIEQSSIIFHQFALWNSSCCSRINIFLVLRVQEIFGSEFSSLNYPCCVVVNCHCLFLFWYLVQVTLVLSRRIKQSNHKLSDSVNLAYSFGLVPDTFINVMKKIYLFNCKLL